MRLKTIQESNSKTLTIYKWMAGENWNVNTREGLKSVGDEIIPLWVGMNLEVMPMFFGLAYNNLSGSDDIYLATLKCIITDPDATIVQPYTTFEYDDSQEHKIGERAYQIGDEESLIMAPATIINLQLAHPDDSYSTVTLIDQKGEQTTMVI